jgi:hypothetical protein
MRRVWRFPSCLKSGAREKLGGPDQSDVGQNQTPSATSPDESIERGEEKGKEDAATADNIDVNLEVSVGNPPIDKEMRIESSETFYPTVLHSYPRASGPWLWGVTPPDWPMLQGELLRARVIGPLYTARLSMTHTRFSSVPGLLQCFVMLYVTAFQTTNDIWTISRSRVRYCFIILSFHYISAASAAGRVRTPIRC